MTQVKTYESPFDDSEGYFEEECTLELLNEASARMIAGWDPEVLVSSEEPIQ